MGLCSFRLNESKRERRRKNMIISPIVFRVLLFVVFFFTFMICREKTQEFGFLCYEDRFVTSTLLRGQWHSIFAFLFPQISRNLLRAEFLITHMSFYMFRFSIDIDQS